MAKRQQFFAFIGFLVTAESGLVNCQDWYNSQRYYPRQSYPQQTQPQSSIDIVQGTIDQLNRIDAKWVCTNPKTGDQMIFGTEIENGNTVNNNALLQRYTATSNTVPRRVQQSNDLQEQVPRCDPSPTQYPQYSSQTRQSRDPGLATEIPLVENNKAPKPLTVEQVREKLTNWDWTQYVTIEPMNNAGYDGTSTVGYEPARKISPTSPTTIGYDGQGVLEPRFRA